MGSSPLLQVQIYNMLQIHVVLCIWKSLERVYLNAICRQSGINGNRKIERQMAIENPVSKDFLSTLVDSIDVFDCRLSGVKLLKIS